MAAVPLMHYRVMVKMSAWLPGNETRPRQGVVAVHTGTDCLWRIDGEPWPYADHVRRWCANHEIFLKRIGLDCKYEKRWPKRARGNINAYREQRCHKFRQRIQTAIQELTAQLVNHLDRRSIAEIQYNDAERSYLTNCAWYQLAQLLRQKAEERGIRMLVESGQGITENEEVAYDQ
jgi:transposase